MRAWGLVGTIGGVEMHEREALAEREAARVLGEPSSTFMQVRAAFIASIPLMRTQWAQDAAYGHPSVGFFEALELSLHLLTAYYHHNDGPGALMRMRQSAPRASVAALEVAWRYPWEQRWALRVLARRHAELDGRAGETFRVLVEDASLDGTLPRTEAEMSPWAAHALEVAQALEGDG